MKTFYIDQNHWFNQVEIEKCQGYVQKCKSCNWLGSVQRKPNSSCPQCGGKLEPDELLALGGVVVVFNGRNIYLHGIRSNARLPCTIVEYADIEEVIKFMARHKD